jgi:hypothetical protein
MNFRRDDLLVYALAPTAQEARDISKAPFEWHGSRLAALRKPVRSSWEWQRHYYDDLPAPTVIGDAGWSARTSRSLLFTDPDGMADHMAALRDTGVRNVVPSTGMGGVQEHVLHSMPVVRRARLAEVRGPGRNP